MKSATEIIIAAFGGFYDDPKNLENELARIDKECAFTIRLVRLRVSMGLSQRELAERAGLSTAAVRRMEAGTDAQLDEDEVKAYLHGLSKRKPAKVPPGHSKVPNGTLKRGGSDVG